MNVEKLKEFRAKLVKAKKLCELRRFNDDVLFAFFECELDGKCVGTKWGSIVPPRILDWYANSKRAPAEREAMWDNSIAAIDVRIAEGKK